MTSAESNNTSVARFESGIGLTFEAATDRERGSNTGVAEVAAVLPSGRILGETLRELFASGFDKNEVSALAMNAGLQPSRTQSPGVTSAPSAAAPAAEIEPPELEGPICLINIGDCAAVVAGGGALAFAIAAALLTNAGSLGCWDFVAHTVAPRHRAAIAALVAEGGALLWVKAAGPTRRNQAARILERHRARYLHLHRVGN